MSRERRPRPKTEDIPGENVHLWKVNTTANGIWIAGILYSA